MALVEIARFVDLTEAQVAASALRASGMEVMLQNEFHGQANFLVVPALGGFRLWVPEDDAADAKAFIAACRADIRPRAPEGSSLKTALAVGIALTLGPAFAILLMGIRKSAGPSTPDP